MHRVTNLASKNCALSFAAKDSTSLLPMPGHGPMSGKRPISFLPLMLVAASLCRNGKSSDYSRKVAGMAQELGLSEQALRKMANRLADLGAIKKEDGDLILLVPSAEEVQKEEDKSHYRPTNSPGDREFAEQFEKQWHNELTQSFADDAMKEVDEIIGDALLEDENGNRTQQLVIK